MSDRAHNLLTWSAIVGLSLIVSLLATHAHAFPTVQRIIDIRPIQDCVRLKFGYAVPEIAPTIIYSPAWSKLAEGMCCTDDGYTAQAHSRAFATYRPIGRIITLYEGGGREHLAHEIASDQFVQATRNFNPRAREIIGYAAERVCA